MAISDTLKADITTRLLRDIGSTVGSGHHHAVQQSVEGAPTFITDPAHFTQWVVDDVQQMLHDTFVDTTWPQCPRHLRHPLWLRVHNDEPTWYCDSENTPIAKLGEL
jgi:hypothetical protein